MRFLGSVLRGRRSRCGPCGGDRMVTSWADGKLVVAQGAAARPRTQLRLLDTRRLSRAPVEWVWARRRLPACTFADGVRASQIAAKSGLHLSWHGQDAGMKASSGDGQRPELAQGRRTGLQCKGCCPLSNHNCDTAWTNCVTAALNRSAEPCSPRSASSMR